MEGINLGFEYFKNFSVIFISIIIEAIPFILLGSLVSALIQIFVSQEFIEKIIPRNKILGYIGAGLMGMVFPVCECAIVPIARRLMKKGVPAGAATTFMLAVPIVNPVVLMSTYYAFYDKPIIVLLRAMFGFLVAITIGFLIDYGSYNKENPAKTESFDNERGCLCGCGFDRVYGNSKFKSILEHTIIEFQDISKYLIFGAFISSMFQITVPRNSIKSIGLNNVYSVIIMIALAFLLSICSEADAFIAKTFSAQFTTGSIIAFLVLGPMLDIKNTLMLMGNFKRGYVAKIIIYTLGLSFIIGCIVNFMSRFGVI